MTNLIEGKDYSLDGPENSRAVQAGLANAVWWQPPIDREKLVTLTQQSNLRAAIDTITWLGLLVTFGASLVISWFSWWSIPLLVVYGALYGGAADSRWHECGHDTAFRNSRLNTAVYYLASFFLWREPTVWKWSHYRHHSDTLIVGRDPEIAFPRPTHLSKFPLLFSHLGNGFRLLKRISKHSLGLIDSEVKDYVPDNEHKRVVWEARIFIIILLSSTASSIWTWHPLPIVLLGLPTIYGAWLFIFFGITQHAGLQEDVLDHRFNTRTVLMNPAFRFLYSNMNYHLEHHLFPEVPYYCLPSLHDELKPYLPNPSPSCIAAYREVFTILKKQKHNIGAEITSRDIPVIGQQKEGVVVFPRRMEITGSFHLGAVGDIKVGAMMKVKHRGDIHLLCRTSETEVRLASGMCTHGNAFLGEGTLSGNTVQCPKHNGQFDLGTGKATNKPATADLTVYNCEIIDGQITTDFKKRQDNA